MDSSNYLTWDVDPIAFSIPEFALPFPVSIWGLFLAVVFFYFGFQKIKPEGKKEVEPEGWKVFALVVVSFLATQLPFIFIDSPTLSTIGPIEPRWYGFMFACAFIFGYMGTGKLYKDAGRSQEDLDRLLIYVLIATVIGARLGHVLFYNPEYYLRNIHLIPQVWTGGLASHGAAIGIIIAMVLYAKKTAGTTFMWVADRVVPGVAIGGMFIRIGNFFNSEIVGVESDLPWAIIFSSAPSLDMAERTLPRHPSMLYESLLCVIVVIILFAIYNRYKKQPPEGALFGTFLVILFTGRILIEFTKETQADFLAAYPVDMGQILSVPLVAYGAWLLWKKVDWKKKPE
jgi:prolipoprotein diacylglyceryl transferase